MKWTAEHSDGFTERLLSYKLRCDDGQADLTAGWFRPRPGNRDFRARFGLDDGPIKRVLPALRAMDAGYKALWTDASGQRLIVEVGTEVIRRDVYGGGILVGKRPELRPFLDLFDWLEGQVLVQLPFQP